MNHYQLNENAFNVADALCAVANELAMLNVEFKEFNRQLKESNEWGKKFWNVGNPTPSTTTEDEW